MWALEREEQASADTEDPALHGKAVRRGASSYLRSNSNNIGMARRHLAALIVVLKRGDGYRIEPGEEDYLQGLLAAGNRITSADNGISYSGFSSGKYMDNLTSSVSTPFSGGTAVGTNN